MPTARRWFSNGDVPLIEAATARALVEACGGMRLALLTVDLADPTGYGRIVRGDPAGRDAAEGGRVHAIREHKDATPTERLISEVYTGAMAAPTALLKRWLAALKNDNVQHEYYLTDVVAMAVNEGVPVVTAQPASETEVLGVNSPVQLADLERRYQRRQAETLMEAGVRLADPARFDLRGELRCGAGRRDRRELRLRRHGGAGQRRAHRRELHDPQRDHRQRRGDPSVHAHRRRGARRACRRRFADRPVRAAAGRARCWPRTFTSAISSR